MSRPVVFRPRFQDDLAAGHDWYQIQQAALGEDLVAAVRSAVAGIEQYAESFAVLHGDVRGVLVPRFPFARHDLSGTSLISNSGRATSLSPRQDRVTELEWLHGWISCLRESSFRER
jgi:hypothetical protein